MELSEARAAVNEMTAINTKANADKRHLESAVHTMHAEIDDMLHQVTIFHTFFPGKILGTIPRKILTSFFNFIPPNSHILDSFSTGISKTVHSIFAS
jgi:hypothetical protein